MQTLAMAADMRHRGDLPKSLSLWAVENPLINSVQRLQRKVLVEMECGVPATSALQIGMVHWTQQCVASPLVCAVSAAWSRQAWPGSCKDVTQY